MIQHPDTTLPEDRLRSACSDLLLTLARDEPAALTRAARTLAGDAARLSPVPPDESPGAQLALAYLAFAGHRVGPASPEELQVFTFSYPAHVVFEVIGAGGPHAAQRLARRSIAAMIECDEPVAGIGGPLPAEPTISNVVVWLGSASPDSDALELETIG